MAEANPIVRANNFKDLTGKTFGRLTVIELVDPGKRKPTHWVCRCECGVIKNIEGHSLRRGKTVSCGCFAISVRTKHGLHESPEHAAWSNMIQRCHNKNAPEFKRYGSRGIQVCDRWRHSFEAFLEDMGYRPSSEHSLDRFPNQNGNYEPLNCRWATRTEQNENKRNNRLITFGETTKTLTNWAKHYGIDPRTLTARLRRGWPVFEALTFPITATGCRRSRPKQASSPQQDSA